MLIVLAVFVILAVAIYAHRYRDRRLCRWRESRADSRGALIKYTCITCGAEAFRAKGAPRECLRAQNRPGL
ncbi:MAG: hypothetical protein P1U53_09525 [Sulfitobacter sp.]|nr:hypothetical protein [Sulfitobacter sp.]